MSSYKCIICGNVVEDYIPEYCCSGIDCGCMGSPIEPPLCSLECTEKIYGSKKQERSSFNEDMDHL